MLGFAILGETMQDKSKAHIGLFLGLFLSGGHIAFSDDVSGDTADSRSEPTTAPVLDEIVITAERRSESIEKSSLAVEVFSGQALQESGISNARDLTKLAPGVIIGQGGPAAQIYIRGVGDFTSTPITNPAVAVNIDGIYVARSQSIDGNFFDIDRVEILKGPQGTLYGRNASGGAINIITNKPQLNDFSVNENLEVGNYNEVNASAAANLPIGDTFAVRFAVQDVHRNGYATQGLDDDKHQSARIHALWQPNDAVSLLVSADYTHVGGLGPAYVFKGVDSTVGADLTALGVALPSNPRSNGTDPAYGQLIYGIGAALHLCIPSGALATATTAAGHAPILDAPRGLCPAGESSLISPPGNSIFGDQAGVDNRFWNVSAELNWKMDFATLTIIPAFRHVEDEYVTYPLVTYNDSFGQPETSDSTSIEARLGNATDLVKWTTGLYYFDENQSAETASNAGVVIGQSINEYSLSTKAPAAFGQVTYSVADRLRLIAGIRFTADHKTINGQNLTGYPGLPFVIGQPCYAETTPCVRDTFIGDKTFRNTTFKTGVEYDVTPKSLLYFTVATGNKSGGFNPASLPGTANVASSFAPEKLTAYELGSRSRFLDDGLELNFESFYWVYKNSQQFYSTLNASGNTVNELANAGSAIVYGLDVDLAYKPSLSDTIRLAVEGLHSRFDQFSYTSAGAIPDVTTGCAVTAGKPFPTINCAGEPLPRAPDYSGTASYTHSFNLPGKARIDATLDSQYSASRYLTVDYTSASDAQSYVILDASLSYYDSDRFMIGGFVRNLTNQLDYTGAYTIPSLFRSLTLANLAAPRTYGLRMSARF
jgi:iron complex outermembrane receptor protein